MSMDDRMREDYEKRREEKWKEIRSYIVGGSDDVGWMRCIGDWCG